jgi:2-alkyl-3-oxoalkanoate reductase
MRILVTGGGGFLGSALIHELLKNPKYIVTSFSRHSYAHLEDLGVPTIKGDLTKPDDVERALSQGFDTVFHVAALAGIWGKYDTFNAINFTGTKNIVESAQRHGVRRFVYTSTPSVVFGDSDLLGVNESTPLPEKYLTHYAETKSRAEKLVLDANNGNSFMTCAIRPHLIWGPGDPHLFPRVIQKGREGKLRIVGDGENLVDIIYVENAAMAHALAMEHLNVGSPVCGEAYFVGQERPVKLWDFINQILGFVKVEPVMNSISVEKAYRLGWALEKIWKMAGIQKPEPPMTRFVALNLGKSHYFSHEKAKKDFGYVPKVSIEEGLQRTFSGRKF